VDEATWLGCADAREMLRDPPRRLSGRKLRLFACACARRAWELLGGWGRRAVETGEAYTDGLATREELEQARRDVWNAILARGRVAPEDGLAAGCTAPSDDDAALGATWYGDQLPVPGGGAAAALLRCIVGNPFRPADANPAWLSWAGGFVAEWAQAIYEERSFAELPALADALADAGCTDAAILEHCRGPGPHARGCFVVDLLTGRE
jgi:hypothetical protein